MMDDRRYRSSSLGAFIGFVGIIVICLIMVVMSLIPGCKHLIEPPIDKNKLDNNNVSLHDTIKWGWSEVDVTRGVSIDPIKSDIQQMWVTIDGDTMWE